MAESRTAVTRSLFGRTMRRDAWWIELVPIILVLGAFSVYATWRAFENEFYEWGPYLSPFYSPLIKISWWPLSPALLILWAPLGFRATCYYYRKAYYRAFFLDPPACAVGESRSHNYRGETAFPFILQNLHRYFLYVALIFLIILWYDAIRAFWFNGRFGIGLGSLVLAGQHRSAFVLYLLLSFVETHRRRQSRLFFLCLVWPGPTFGLAGR